MNVTFSTGAERFRTEKVFCCVQNNMDSSERNEVNLLIMIIKINIMEGNVRKPRWILGERAAGEE